VSFLVESILTESVFEEPLPLQAANEVTVKATKAILNAFLMLLLCLRVNICMLIQLIAKGNPVFEKKCQNY
jgi:hypothetical protein